MSHIDFTNSQQIDAIFQEAVDKAVAKHQESYTDISIY